MLYTLTPIRWFQQQNRECIMAKLLQAKNHDIGGLDVKRVLPHPNKKMVGPFIFFDQMGPNTFPPGKGINVRPHPHIGLSTLTYLFSGSIHHRDSLGNNIEISPGDLNWMTSGKGIVHSERESLEVRASEHTVHGLQCWIALPKDKTEIEPSFTHTNKQLLPNLLHKNTIMRLVVGEAYGLVSPVKTHSPMFFIDVISSKDDSIAIPNPNQETAALVIYGQIAIKDQVFSAGEFVLLDNDEQRIKVLQDARFILLGGDKFDQPPLLEWNFVAYDKATIEQAKEDWRQGRFPTIAGDDRESIPL